MQTSTLSITQIELLKQGTIQNSDYSLLPLSKLAPGQQLTIAKPDFLKSYLVIDANKSDLQFSILAFLRKQKPLFSSNIEVVLPELDNHALRSILIAWELSDYDIGLYKEDKKVESTATSFQFISNHQDFEQLLAKAKLIAAAKKRMLDLVNMPGNKLNSIYWKSYMESSSKRHGYKLNLDFGTEQVAEKGYTALLGVNRGSEWPPLFVHASHHMDEHLPNIAFIGKGVTFDTGGLSIKGSQNMHYMKSDMGGAAAALGAFEAIVDLKLPINLDLYLPITDNCVDATSIKPGDIIEAYGGKTIEVINTDAEGRLILADALSLATENGRYKAIIDLATLTGSTVRTFANYAAALFSKNDELCKQIKQAARVTKENIWRMPLWDVYADHLHSDVADIANLGNIPAAGAITAAKFLEFFTHEHNAWAHLDIPAMAFGKTPYGKEKSATAYGVELLVSWAEQLQHS